MGQKRYKCSLLWQALHRKFPWLFAALVQNFCAKTASSTSEITSGSKIPAAVTICSRKLNFFIRIARLVHVQNFFFGGGGWQAVSLGGGVTVMEKRKFWQGG